MRGPGEDWKARALAAEVSRDTLGDRLLEAQATIKRVRELSRYTGDSYESGPYDITRWVAHSGGRWFDANEVLAVLTPTPTTEGSGG